MTSPVNAGRKTRVLLIGAGRRVQNNFLPALHCLAADLELVGIHARTTERLLPLAQRWGVRAFTRLQDVDFSTVDVVAISIPTSQNAVVLRSLAPYSARLAVVIDTPIAWTRSELGACDRALRNFKRVLVTEDYMNFPPFALLRRAVSDGLIGSLEGITLYNIGFLYHGLALIRSFGSFRRVKSAWCRNAGSLCNVVAYSLQGGYRGIVVGPYRKHTAGGITLEGTKGVLTDFQGDASFASGGGRPVYCLTAHRESDRLLSGFSIDAPKGEYELSLPQIRAMAALDFPDKSDLNLLRGCGLIRVFQALHEPENLNNAYGPANALYDSFVPRIAQRGLLPFDPFVWVGSDVVRTLRTLS